VDTRTISRGLRAQWDEWVSNRKEPSMNTKYIFVTGGWFRASVRVSPLTIGALLEARGLK
jgi:hypothetical protein